MLAQQGEMLTQECLCSKSQYGGHAREVNGFDAGEIAVMDIIHHRQAGNARFAVLAARLGQNVTQGRGQFFRLEFGSIGIGPHAFDVDFICCAG